MIILLTLSLLSLAGELEKRLKKKGLHVAELTHMDKINLQINKLQQAIQQQWIDVILGMLSEDYVEADPSVAHSPARDRLEQVFSAVSQVRGVVTQINPETGWGVTATHDFCIQDVNISVQGDEAIVTCDIGFSSAAEGYRSIAETLSFVRRDDNWFLAGSKILFGFLQKASGATKEALGIPHVPPAVTLASKDDYVSSHLLAPITFYHYGKTAIPRFNQTESRNWFGFNCMNWPNGIVADVEICEGGPDFNHNYLFVSDPIANKIIGSDQDGWVGEFGSQGSGVGQFWGPHGMCTVIGYYYFVADRLNDRVTAYIYYNQLDEPQWYSDLNLYANFNHPRDVAAKDRNPYDLQDKTYLAVADEYNHRLALFLWFPYDLRLDRYYGEYGSGEGQFIKPTSVCFGRDPQTGWQTNDIFVTDNGNHRLVRLYAQLDTLYMIHWRGTYQFPPDVDLTSVDVDNNGLVYVVDRRNGKVYKFAPSEGYPYYFKLLGIWGETGTEDGQLYYPNTLQVAHGRYVPYPDPWVPLTGLGDVFITESWGGETGVRRFVIAADVLNLAATYKPYNESTGGGDSIYYGYTLTDCANVTEEIYRGAEWCTTYTPGTLNWGPQGGARCSWSVRGKPHGTYYTVKITASSIYDPTIVVEQSVDVYVDTWTVHNPIITQGIRCNHDNPLPFWCDGCYQCIKENQLYTIDVQAYDPDGYPLTYEWSCSKGYFDDGTALYKEITTSENYVCYYAPSPPGGAKPPIYEAITVFVRNPIGGEALDRVIMDSYLYPSETTCLCGDANDDGIVNVGDVVTIQGYLYGGGQIPEPIERADANDDCIVDAGDMVYLVNYLYKGGPAPKCCWLHEWTP